MSFAVHSQAFKLTRSRRRQALGRGFLMGKGKPGSRLHFHDWEAVLEHSALPSHRKESWAITIRWYLSWARRARVPVDFDSARDFMAQVEVEKHPSAHRLEQWKEALRWLFREGKRRGGSQDAECRVRSWVGVPPQASPLSRRSGSDGGDALPHPGPLSKEREVRVGVSGWRERAIRLIRVRKYTYSTEQSYMDWLSRFAQFIRPRDLLACGETEIRTFLDHLAVEGKVSASTQRQALNALVFLYREVLERDLGDFSDYRRAKAATHMRTSMTRPECDRFMAAVEPSMKLLVAVLYGSGLRLMECLRLRVKDLDLERRTLTVRAGKGNKDRVTVLAECVIEPLEQHLKNIREVWEGDRRQGLAGVWLPEALSRKYPKAGEAWEWFWVWPSREISVDPRGGTRRRHHVLDKRVQQAVRRAARKAGLNKRITPHVLRHTFATLMLEGRTDPRTLQELMGHKRLETTQGYLHVMNRPGLGIRSPLDRKGDSQ